ncbi:unnamed protein product [Meloidogyne enterolobii]|uniref:Uncharacterized protein n=1 Tax=Meloidogyne enterolobii TaxID=390850 RepID=A0ACB1ATM9_MELEN
MINSAHLLRQRMPSLIIFLLFLSILLIMVQFTNATVRERRQSGGTPVASSGKATANGSNTVRNHF